MLEYEVKIEKSALKSLRKLPEYERLKIMAQVRALTNNPRPSGHIKLTGIDKTYRIRIGDYRIIYEIHDGILLVMVVRVDHRKNVYR